MTKERNTLIIQPARSGSLLVRRRVPGEWPLSEEWIMSRHKRVDPVAEAIADQRRRHFERLKDPVGYRRKRADRDRTKVKP